MRIAIIGSGISGLLTARLLSRRHDVTVFEAGDYAGGHTHTVEVVVDDERHAIDTGFIVFNHKTYPNFTRLLDMLRVPTTETAMTFSVRCDRTGLEYNGASLNTLYAQRRNLLRPSFHGMVQDILRFNRDGATQAARMNGASIRQFLTTHTYGARFREHYLIPLGASIWSCPPHAFLDFPVRFVMDFFSNHGMLQVQNRPTWRVIRGGSARYVDALTAPFAERIRLGTPVHSVRRGVDAVSVRTRGHVERFDEAVIAVHSDDALAMLEDPSPDEQKLLARFPYQANTAVLHTDTSVLPRRPRARAAWNYRLPATPAEGVMVTYNMNILQGLHSPHVFCVSLNQPDTVAPSTVLGRFCYRHPLYTTGRDDAQRQHASVLRRNRTSFCGAYWGYGFHEDGVRSALAVCAAFGEEL